MLRLIRQHINQFSMCISFSLSPTFAPKVPNNLGENTLIKSFHIAFAMP